MRLCEYTYVCVVDPGRQFDRDVAGTSSGADGRESELEVVLRETGDILPAAQKTRQHRLGRLEPRGRAARDRREELLRRVAGGQQLGDQLARVGYE